MWKNFLNLFKGNSKVVHLGTNKKGIEVFRETLKDGSVRTWSEKMGKVWRETIQNPIKDLGANSKQKITTCKNYENNITTNIEHRLNLYKEAEEICGFNYRSNTLSHFTGLKIPETGRYHVVYKTSNDFARGAINETLTAVGKNTVGNCKQMSTGSTLGNKYFRQEFKPRSSALSV